MTTVQLSRFGIIYVGSALYPRRYIVPEIGECTIPENYDITDIFSLIYEKAFKLGIEEGKEKKAEEIRNCLNI